MRLSDVSAWTPDRSLFCPNIVLATSWGVTFTIKISSIWPCTCYASPILVASMLFSDHYLLVVYRSNAQIVQITHVYFTYILFPRWVWTQDASNIKNMVTLAHSSISKRPVVIFLSILDGPSVLRPFPFMFAILSIGASCPFWIMWLWFLSCHHLPQYLALHNVAHTLLCPFLAASPSPLHGAAFIVVILPVGWSCASEQQFCGSLSCHHFLQCITLHDIACSSLHPSVITSPCSSIMSILMFHKEFLQLYM